MAKDVSPNVKRAREILRGASAAKKVRPLTHDGPAEDFKPRYDNWRRDAKVPDLILNATALNTGHNWAAVPVTFVHLFFFDKLFLRHGRIGRITGK